MHEEGERSVALWEEEQERDGLLAEWRGLTQALEGAKTKRSAAAAALAEAEATREVLRKSERALNRRLETYIGRRDKTRRLIDEGKVSDYHVAQQQCDQCGAIVDDVETELLELMEQLEEAEEAEGRARDLDGLATVRLSEADTSREARRSGLKAELEAVTARRDAAKALLAHDIRGRYDLLRKRGRDVIADVRGASCTRCNVKLNSVQLMDFRRQNSLHHCNHCSRFLRHDLDN